MRIDNNIEPRILVAPLKSENQEEAFEILTSALAEVGAIPDADAAMAALLERETYATTNLGNGLAIPHGIVVGVERVIAAIGICPEPIPYPGEGEVRVVILLIGPKDKPDMHVRALAHVARIMRQPGIVDHLVGSTDPHRDLVSLLEDEASRPFPQ